MSGEGGGDKEFLSFLLPFFLEVDVLFPFTRLIATFVQDGGNS